MRAVLLAFENEHRDPLGGGAADGERVGDCERQPERELDPAVKLQQAAGQQADLAPTVVEVLARPTGGIVRLGSRELADPAALTPLLSRLDNKQDGAIVLVDDEAPFDLAASAIQACKAAGLSLVSYVPRGLATAAGNR